MIKWITQHLFFEALFNTSLNCPYEIIVVIYFIKQILSQFS